MQKLRRNSIATGLALVALGILLCQMVPSGRPVITADYTLDLTREDGAVGVTVEVSSQAGPLGVSAMLADKLVCVEEFRALRTDGAELPIQRTERWVQTGKTNSLFTYYTVDGDGQKLRLQYVVRPALRKATLPCGEERHVASREKNYCYLTGPSCLLLPSQLTGATVAVKVPDGWDVVSTFPSIVHGVDVDESAWSWSLAAGRFRTVEHQGVQMHVQASVARDVEVKVRDAIGKVVQALGLPRQRFAVVLVPAASDKLRLEKGPSTGLIVADIANADVSSLKQLVRQLVTRWHGAPGRLHWLRRGLAEYLAHMIPEQVGADNTSPRMALEFTWMRDREHAAKVDLCGPLHPWHELKAAVVVYELQVAAAEKGGSLSDLFSCWTGSGDLVIERPEVLAVARRIVRRAESAVPFVARFEQAWQEDGSPPEGHREVVEASAAESGLELRFLISANTEGHLENCGCKANQSGGLARRVAAIKAARAEGELTVLDLGNFFPIRALNPVLDPFIKGELPLHLEAMKDAGYDAVCVGTNEVLGDADSLGLLRSFEGLPLLGSGIRFQGETVAPSAVITQQGGVRIGIIGLTEKLSYGSLREPHERNAVGASFESGVRGVEVAMAELSRRVDLMVVAGRFSVPTERALRALGVDITVNAEVGSEIWRDPCVMRDGVLVVHEDASSFGLTDLRVRLASGGKPASGRVSTVLLSQDKAGDEETANRITRHYATMTVSDAQMASVRPLFEWDDRAKGRYMGSKVCGSCHAAEYQQWLGTGHASAMSTLRKKGRDRNPACVQCHVLGLGRADGYQIGGRRNDLEGVQCEACHGAGAEHVSMPSRGNIRRLPEQQVCLECHDEKHSEGFANRWESVLALVGHKKGLMHEGK